MRNVFAALSNIDARPIVHNKRAKGQLGRWVRAATINLAGGRARLAELMRVIETGVLGVEIVAVQETWLRDKETLSIPGFTYFGCNRAHQSTRGDGGVGVFVANHLIASQVTEFKEVEEEWMWVRVEMVKGCPLFVCCFYGPAEHDSRESVQAAYSRLGQQIATLQSKGYVLALGDFNAKLGSGGKRVGRFSKSLASPNGTIVEKMLEEHNLWSLVDRDAASSGPTFFSAGGNTTIDHVVVCEQMWGCGAKVTVRKDAEIGSDHIPVVVD